MLLGHRCSHLVQPGGEGAPRVTDFRPRFASATMTLYPLAQVSLVLRVLT
jgi:hypothetical protein